MSLTYFLNQVCLFLMFKSEEFFVPETNVIVPNGNLNKNLKQVFI